MNNIERAIGVVIVTWMASAASGQSITSAEDGWAAMRKCAAIVDESSRHACSDNVLRKAGLLTGAGAKDPAAKDDQLEVTLANVTQAGDGKLLLTTTEGAVWRQVESQAIRPMPTRGQSMKIEKTSFGGFMCKPGKWVAFRCFRAR
jgi:hypothetical protein